ncbi:MAG: MarR family transcriptional regulator [Eggerthellaceae bacterium]|nr:MarR family transcriptional regulator [Eggerthellaceae bacterium]
MSGAPSAYTVAPAAGVFDALKLENQLCFPLYACAKEVVRRYTPLLEDLGLTYTQYICLMALWEADGVSVRELGARLSLDSGTLTPLLKRLEARGLVQRERSAADERCVTVRLTEAGRALRREAEAIPAKMACSLPLSVEEGAQLAGLLWTLLARMSGEEK